MSDERRREGRVPAIIQVNWEAANARYEARTSDLTTSGCFIDTIVHSTVGEIISFKLLLPSVGQIEVHGEVMYVSPTSGFGVRFTDISDADRKKLEWLVRAEEYKAKKEKETG